MIDAAPYPYLPEMILRGAAAGLCLLFAARLARRAPLFGAANLCALFSVGTAAYVLVGTPAAEALGAGPVRALAFLAALNSVFFWWAATALFDDDFAWRWWRLVPFAALIALYALRLFEAPLVAGAVDDVFHQSMIIAMMVHALWLVVANRRDDLVETRRRFRLAFAGLIGAAGIVIAVAELVFYGSVAPVWLTTFHAASLFTLTFLFANWILRAAEIFPSAPVAAPSPSPTGAAPAATVDDAARVRLEAAMEAGAYRREGLTIAMLADEIAYPEYKLRQLINGRLGFHNFSAFLNSYRIAEAKRILSNPEQARTQITQVALDLGYGSIAPFNRAFKAAEGATPSAYRKQALIAAAGA